MLPPRAYASPLPPLSAGARAEPSAADARPSLVVAASAADVERFPASPFARFAARNTSEAVRLIERWRPRVVAIDWDMTEFDAAAISEAARQVPGAGLLATMAVAETAPAALKAGAHAVLLKPLTTSLLAARLGRLAREMPTAAAASRIAEKLGQFGTNRLWADLSCPKCVQMGAVGFEYSSHRRTWYACLKCDAVWLGRRRE